MAPPYPASFKFFDGWRAAQVPPATAPDQVRNRMFFRACSAGDVCHSNSASQVQSPYFSDCRLGEGAIPNIFPHRHTPNITTFGVKRGLSRSSSAFCVSGIFRRRSPSQMMGIAAYRIVATVKCMLPLFRRTVKQETGYSGRCVLAAYTVCGDIKNAIPKAMARPRYPRPALIFTAAQNLRPKARNLLIAHVYHGKLLSIGGY